MKLIRRVVLGLIVLVVVAVGGAWLMVDSIAKKGIEQGGQMALGVPTDVQTVNFGLLNGSVMIEGLKVGNPAGFTSPCMVKTGKFDVAVKPSSVLSEPIVVEKFILDGLELNLEQAGAKNNVSMVLDHIKQLGGQGGPEAQGAEKPAAPTGHEQHAAPQGGGEDKGTRLMISKIVIKNVVAQVYLPAGKPLTVKVPEIVMENVSNDNAKGITTNMLIARVLPAVVAAVLENGKGVIPADMAGMLSGDLSGISAKVGGSAANLIKQAGGGLPSLPGRTSGTPGGALGGAMTLPAGGVSVPKLPAAPSMPAMSAPAMPAMSAPAMPSGAVPAIPLPGAATPAAKAPAAAPAASPSPAVDAPKALDSAVKGLLSPASSPAK